MATSRRRSDRSKTAVAAMEEDQNGRTREGEGERDTVLEALGFRVYAVRAKGGFLRGGNENMYAWGSWEIILAKEVGGRF